MQKTRAQGRDARSYRIGEGREEAQQEFRCDVENMGDSGGKGKKCREERVGSVAADPDIIENINEAGRQAQRTQSLSVNCRSRKSVPISSRL